MKREFLTGISYILLMGIGFPVMRYMSLEFNVINNNAIRFLSGGIFLLIISVIKYRKEMSKLVKTPLVFLQIFFLSILMTLNMYFFISGLRYTSALTGSIFAVLSMPLGIIIATVFYTDERVKVKNKFYLGVCISVISSFAFIFFSNTYVETNNFLKGSIFLTTAIFIQAFQNLLVKFISKKIYPLIISAFTASFSGGIFLLVSFLTGSIYRLSEKSNLLLILLVLAGVYGMITGMLMAFYIVQTQGIVFFNLIQILVPISTSLLAYLILREKISIMQGLSALVVILGSIISLKNK